MLHLAAYYCSLCASVPANILFQLTICQILILLGHSLLNKLIPIFLVVVQTNYEDVGSKFIEVSCPI